MRAFDRGWAPQDFRANAPDRLADNAPPPPSERLPITPPEVLTTGQRADSEPGAGSDLQNERTMAVRDSDIEALKDLAPTVRSILSQEVGARFVPQMEPNHYAFHAGEAQAKLRMNGTQSQHKILHDQANTLEERRRKFPTVADRTVLGALLSDTGCLPFLEAA